MNEFDENLRARLQRDTGGTVDVAAGHDAVLTRAGQIRRRRAAVAGGGALTVLVVGGLILLTPGTEDTLAPAEPTVSTTAPVSTPNAVVDTTMSPTATTVPAGDGVTTSTSSPTAPDTTAPLVVATPPSSPTLNPASTSSTSSTEAPVVAEPTTTERPTTSPTTTSVAASATSSTSGSTSSTTSPSTSSSSSTSSTSSSTTSPGVAPFTRTYDSAGGSITVDWDGSQLSLLAVTPQPGFEAEIEDQSATRVRVRFRGEPDDSRIEVRTDGGELRVDIS